MIILFYGAMSCIIMNNSLYNTIIDILQFFSFLNPNKRVQLWFAVTSVGIPNIIVQYNYYNVEGVSSPAEV